MNKIKELVTQIMEEKKKGISNYFIYNSLLESERFYFFNTSAHPIYDIENNHIKQKLGYKQITTLISLFNEDGEIKVNLIEEHLPNKMSKEHIQIEHKFKSYLINNFGDMIKDDNIITKKPKLYIGK